MEFIQEFAVIQGTLLTLQKKVGPLKNLTKHDSGTKEKIQTVVNTLLKVLHSFEVADHTQACIKLRHISLFLVLNSDLKVWKAMKEDPNWGHLIESAPTLSNHIMIDVFTTPLLCKYFHELVVYCPPVLSAELLEVAVSKLKRELSSVPLSCIAIFIKAVYVKLLRSQKYSSDHTCEVNCSALKFKMYYSKFLEFLIEPSRVNSKYENSQFLEEFGQNLRTSLELVTSCLMLFVNPVEVDDDLSVYKMNLAFDYKIWHQESDDTIFESMHEQLFSVLVVQISHVTVDLWLSWAELDSKFVKNFSLQKDIAELMYKCHKVIQAAKEKGVKSLLFEGLISMLSSMAIKPLDEDDEIKEADMALILIRISDQSFCRRKWLLALFTKYDDALLKEECVECIDRNIDLMDSEIILLFLEKIFLVIKNGEKQIISEKVKGLFLCAASQLCLEEQLQLLKKFLDKYGVNSHLCSTEYYSKVTKVFNTAVNSSEVSYEKKHMEFVNLCFQNPLDMMNRLLEHSVASDKQAQVIGDVIVMLTPFHSLCVNENDQDPVMFLIKILYEIMLKKNDIEFSDTSFVNLVTILATKYVISPGAFVKKNLLPLMLKSLKDSKWADIILWLETLQIFVDGTVKCDNTLDTATLLVTTARIMELSRKNLYLFSYAALSACDHALKITGILIESVLDMVEDTILVPLCEKIMNLTSPINQYYFIDLWKTSENYSNFTADWKVYLLHWMYMEKCNLEPPWSSSVDLQRKRIILELSQLLPVCVKNEWLTVIQNLHNLMSPMLGEYSNTFVFECLIDAIQIMSLSSSALGLADKEQECAFCCLDYCIRNLSAVAKEELTEKPDSITVKTASILFQKIANLNSVLPGIVKDSCAGTLLSMQVDFILKAICGVQMCSTEEDEEKQIIEAQWNEELQNMVISITVINDPKTRQALARKLQEGLGVL